MTKNKVLNDYTKLKKIAASYIEAEEWELALKSIFVASGLMYTMNQIQYDSELEGMLKKIAAVNLKNKTEKRNFLKAVVFYDGLGNIKRGLSKIYLEALKAQNVKLFYVTFEKFEKELGNVEEFMPLDNVYLIKGKTFLEQMKSLEIILDNIPAENAFIYTTPDDVVGVGAFSVYQGKMNRFLVNLTDHSFWIGKIGCDVIVNFREFGWRMCELKRECLHNELAYLPYYPKEEKEEVKRLPFFENSRKFIFSGGALYKTESKDNQYYKLVDSILSTVQDVDFVYFGNGNSEKIRKLIVKYPDRIVWEKERTDFFEVMKKCTLYLSTYPYNGGLMTQYALLAGKLPITLHCEGVDKELSIHFQESLWDFDSFDSCLSEIKKLLEDDLYRKEKEKNLNKYLVTSKEFEEELKYLLDNASSIRECSRKTIEYEGFSKIPLENYKGLKYYRLFFRKNGSFMLKFFPKEYILGGIAMIREKLIKK